MLKTFIYLAEIKNKKLSCYMHIINIVHINILYMYINISYMYLYI